MDYSLIKSHILFDVDEIMEILEEYTNEHVLVEHYFDDQLLDTNIIIIENIEIEVDPGKSSIFFKQKYLNSDIDNQEFMCFLKRNFTTGLFINGSMVEIEIHNGHIIGLIGNRGELILRTGLECYVFSPLFKLTIQPNKSQTILNSLLAILKSNHKEINEDRINSETFSMIAGICLMAIAKLNELPINNYEINLSHDEMLLFGLALNLISESGDREIQAATRPIMEQIKVYFPEIEHISPESFEAPPKMGQIIDFKKPNNLNKD